MLLSDRLNRRTSTRKQLLREISAIDSSGKEHTFYSYNYSTSGIAVLSQECMKVGDVFQLRFIISDESCSSEYQISAEVVQDYHAGAVHVAGMKFQHELTLH